MSIFPLIADLPPVLNVSHWAWEKIHTPGPYPRDLWRATDRNGNHWVTKTHGSFYAYREIVFARLAQKLGWSCQSSVFGVFPDSALPIVKGDCVEERVHALHWYIPEHQAGKCGPNCPLARIDSTSIQALQESGCPHITDLPKSQIAARLFGANEPAGRLFTRNHEFVIIDSEQMFSTGPCDLRDSIWWNSEEGTPSPSGRRLVLQVCFDVAALTNMDLNEILSVPDGIRIRCRWSIKDLLKHSHKYARKFLKEWE